MTSLSQHVIGRMTALLFMGTALVGALSPTPAGTSQAARLALTAIAFLLGAAAWLAPWDRWPRAATLLLVPPALGMLASAILNEDVVARADAALYTAKRDGRDRITNDEALDERRATPA